MEPEVVNECERLVALERIARINAEAIGALAALNSRVEKAITHDLERHFNLVRSDDRGC